MNSKHPWPERERETESVDGLETPENSNNNAHTHIHTQAQKRYNNNNNNDSNDAYCNCPHLCIQWLNVFSIISCYYKLLLVFSCYFLIVVGQRRECYLLWLSCHRRYRPCRRHRNQLALFDSVTSCHGCWWLNVFLKINIFLSHCCLSSILWISYSLPSL